MNVWRRTRRWIARPGEAPNHSSSPPSIAPTLAITRAPSYRERAGAGEASNGARSAGRASLPPLHGRPFMLGGRLGRGVHPRRHAEHLGDARVEDVGALRDSRRTSDEHV